MQPNHDVPHLAFSAIAGPLEDIAVADLTALPNEKALYRFAIGPAADDEYPCERLVPQAFDKPTPAEPSIQGGSRDAYRRRYRTPPFAAESRLRMRKGMTLLPSVFYKFPETH